MTIWSDKPGVRLALLLAVTSAVVAGLYAVISSSSTRHAGGWETEESARQPFKPGFILNGQPPADFEISIVKPGPDTPITLGPGEPCEFVVHIKMLDDDSPNATIPPTFVSVNFLKGKRFAGGGSLKPSSIDNHIFAYSGRLYAPGTVGNYGTSVEVKYEVFAPSGGQPKEFAITGEGITVTGSISGGVTEKASSYQKSLKGPDFHVKR